MSHGASKAHTQSSVHAASAPTAPASAAAPTRPRGAPLLLPDPEPDPEPDEPVCPGAAPELLDEPLEEEPAMYEPFELYALMDAISKYASAYAGVPLLITFVTYCVDRDVRQSRAHRRGRKGRTHA